MRSYHTDCLVNCTWTVTAANCLSHVMSHEECPCPNHLSQPLLLLLQARVSAAAASSALGAEQTVLYSRLRTGKYRWCLSRANLHTLRIRHRNMRIPPRIGRGAQKNFYAIVLKLGKAYIKLIVYYFLLGLPIHVFLNKMFHSTTWLSPELHNFASELHARPHWDFVPRESHTHSLTYCCVHSHTYSHTHT